MSNNLSVNISAQEANDLSLEDMDLGEYVTDCVRRYALNDYDYCRVHVDRGWDKVEEIREDMRVLGFETEVSRSPDGKVRHLYITW